MRELKTTTMAMHTLLVSHWGRPPAPYRQVGPGGVRIAKAANVRADPTALSPDCSELLFAHVLARDASACALVWRACGALDRAGEALCTSERRAPLAPQGRVGDALCSCLLPAEALLEVRDLLGGALCSSAGSSLGVLFFLLGDLAGGCAAFCTAAALRLGACWRSTTAEIAQRMLKTAVKTAYAIRCAGVRKDVTSGQP